MSDTVIHLGTQKRFTVAGVGPDGEPEGLDARTALRFDNVTGGTVLQSSTDPLGFVVVPDQTVGGTGSAIIVGDADPNDGVVEVSGALNWTVIPNAAVSIGVTEGAEEAIGTAP